MLICWMFLLLNFSCKKEESISFSIEPKIQFENIQFIKGTKSFNSNPLDTILMTFLFSDGDGNLGRQYDYYYETLPPFNPIFFLSKENGQQISSDRLFNNMISSNELVSYSDRNHPPYDNLPSFTQSPCDWFIYSQVTTVDTLFSIKNQNFYNLDITIMEYRDNEIIPFSKCVDYDGLIPPITSKISSNRSYGPFVIKQNSLYDGAIIYKMSIHGEYFGPTKLKITAKITDETGFESNTIESNPFDIY